MTRFIVTGSFMGLLAVLYIEAENAVFAENAFRNKAQLEGCNIENFRLYTTSLTEHPDMAIHWKCNGYWRYFYE